MPANVSKVSYLGSTSTNRRTIDLLPTIFKTDRNAKFLAGTIDQYLEPAKVERINGWVGTKNTPTYNPFTDNYIPTNSPLRSAYQVEPALIVNDANLKPQETLAYDDLINQLKFNGANVSNLGKLFNPEFYSYNPNINWDKLVNFEKYYWMPYGPDVVTVTGQLKKTVSSYTVSDANGNFLFTPDGLTEAPQLTLYRGVTYIFNIRSAKNFWIKTQRVAGTDSPFRVITTNGISNGQIIFTVDENTPKKLYYVAEDNVLNGGEIVIESIADNSNLDIENDIIGKSTFTSGNGVVFSNGMRISFAGNITPVKYQTGEYFVEGVGSEIKLINAASLEVPEQFISSLDDNFDGAPFDDYPFDTFINAPLTPEYVTIDRSSIDRNPWTRYNRWFHEDVIISSATYNNRTPVLPVESRAKRPIVEFLPNLQLFNFGSLAVENVQHLDSTTTDVFNFIEGSEGFYVDGVELANGDRIIFTANSDNYVNQRVWIVNFVQVNGKLKIALIEDNELLIGTNVVITQGTKHKGSSWWFDGTKWVYAQQKTVLNQAPRFDVFDADGYSLNDTAKYQSNFTGTKIFGYGIGTGVKDSILGFPLKYQSVADQAFYLFENYFTQDQVTIVNGNQTSYISVATNFLKKNSLKGYSYINVWEEALAYTTPILQSIVPTSPVTVLEITCVDFPAYQNLTLEVYRNNIKLFENVDYTRYADTSRLFTLFNQQVKTTDHILFKVYGNAVPNSNGYYETSPGWLNNPMNGDIQEFTLSELTDHFKSMADRNPKFAGSYLGSNNSRDLINFASYGTRLIKNKNPLSFAGYFITDQTHNVISAITSVERHYTQFKLAFVSQATALRGIYTPSKAVDIILHNMNLAKNPSSQYYHADMLAYGPDVIINTITVTDSRNTMYGLNTTYVPSVNNPRSVVVYHVPVSTGLEYQLVYGHDYTFDQYDPTVVIIKPLVKGDQIIIRDYLSTDGSFIPPTPTKLGLYPKFIPEIYYDNSYAGDPKLVIRGHDGSVSLAFNDYRDQIILELETRIYNNIKVNYNPELVNIHSVIPGRFRLTKVVKNTVNNILRGQFLKWNNFYGFDYELNDTVSDDPKTWNFITANDPGTKIPLLGNHRGIYSYYFDTTTPHLTPWEMLGFSEMPNWWVDTYGPAPYTSGNLILWDDLEKGYVRDPMNPAINPLYVRTGLSKIIPVDEYGNLLDPAAANIAQNVTANSVNLNWTFGDQGPVETAWRRSSHYPFSIQILMALSNPASYASLLFDTSRVNLNSAGQYVYSKTNNFFKLSDLLIYGDTSSNSLVRATGYSVMLVETGKTKSLTYISDLKTYLSNMTMQLLTKVGGFVSKDKLEVIIDSINPASVNPGVALSNEDYQIFLNQSSVVDSVSVSGIIIQKTDTGYILRGYDNTEPYFTSFTPIPGSGSITIGGKSESFVKWAPSSPTDSGLTPGELATAVTANTGYIFYKAGQVVYYNGRYYRAKVGHNSGSTFNINYFQPLPSLPYIGGISVSTPVKFDTTPVITPYGVTFSTYQEVYDLIIGYGAWLESQGVIFDEYNSDLNDIMNWNYTGKEFLYWASQGWSSNSIITLSPFANSLQYQNTTAMVDDLGNTAYEYSVLKADGKPLLLRYLNVMRQDGTISVSTKNTNDGIYFIRFNSVQKEHNLIFNNTSLFNDIIYNVETGYSQRRLKLNGLRTSQWDGSLYSPGFIYDEAMINNWAEYTDYHPGDIVLYSGNYYSAIKKLTGVSTFNFGDWQLLDKKPTAQLLPNFDYKINQFQDFYSLDIDNFDANQQSLAQHLIGYTPRPYLDNIFANPVSQYKFYQGFIREKGTRNSITKLAKASKQTLDSYIDYYEEWAFRVGEFGSYNTDFSIELNLDETKFEQNSQVIEFVPTPADKSAFQTHIYQTPSDLVIKPDNYKSLPFATTSSVYSDVFKLPYAGYVRLDDVTATAFNKATLVDVSNSRGLSDGDTIWIGFTENLDWNVYRHTKLSASVIDVSIIVQGLSLQVTTDSAHNLSPNDFINITQFDVKVNGIYQVQSVISNNQFIVKTLLTTLPTAFYPGLGILFKFISVRFDAVDSIIDSSLINTLGYGEKLWIDNDGTGRWIVLEKQNPYTISSYQPSSIGIGSSINSRFAENLLINSAGEKIIASAPNYQNTLTSVDGLIYALRKNGTGTNSILNVAEIKLNINTATTYYSTTSSSGFGTSIVLDSDNDILIAGAPYASHVKYTTSTSTFYRVTINSTTGTYVNQGLVKWENIAYDYDRGTSNFVITSPEPQSNAYFGHAIYLGNRSTSEKLLAVTSPGQNSNSGAVHWSRFSVTTTNTISYINTITTTSTQHKLDPIEQRSTAGDQFGHAISGDYAGNILAVSAPGLNDNQGGVYVFAYESTNTRFTNTQLITAFDLGITSTNVKFGNSVLIDKTGNYLFIGAPGTLDTDFKIGKVFVLVRSGNKFAYSQTLLCPVNNSGFYFGSNLTISPNGKSLYISSIQSSVHPDTTFDTHNNSTNTNPTTFDGKTTTFNSKSIEGNKSIYEFERLDSKFYFAHEVPNPAPTSYQIFGNSIAASDNCILVGSPGQTTGITSVGYFNIYDYLHQTWNTLRYEDDLIDLTKVKTAKTIDTTQQTIVDYLEIYDPLKGRIPALADQEIKYKTAFDPAVYSIGVPGVTVDTNTNWLDEHVGELWWDLNSVKYVWYEQGELDFRNNSWGNLFPGCTIDVYEWVSSTNMPNQWSAIADTNAGLSQNISGQPKFPSNSVLSIKQVYNATTNGLTNVYYFWVKNKITIPQVPGRNMSAYDVSQLIANPKSQGMKYVSLIADNALSLTNMKPSVIGTNINLNIDMDSTNNVGNKHTEWLLVQEGNANSQFNDSLMQKFKDSLLGRDSLGNPVPDPTLSDRLKYGVSIRPRQSIFKDRFSALRAFTEYSNAILNNINFVGTVNLDYFTSNETYALPAEGVYDIVVDSVVARDQTIITRKLAQTTLSVSLTYGRITKVTITTAGYGYGKLYPVAYDINDNPTLWVGPTVEIIGNGTDAKIITYVNTVGQIVQTEIKNSGKNYTSVPTVIVRPFTVLVQSDETVNNRWSYYTWDYTNKVYTRTKTQSWNTPEYWSYADWKDPTYNKNQDIRSTVDSVYELAYVENVKAGTYVKVNNAGDGRYIILRKTNGTTGTFDNQFDLIYQQNGTIQINDMIWDNQFGFDYQIGFDQLKYDQKPDKETENIINGILNFVTQEHSKYANLIMFKMVKYALTEQKFLDWAFKTSFITVVNNAGALDQRPTYRLNNETYYEQYINETKPYHTKIRNFQANYTATDFTQSLTTDFDTPAVYNTLTQKFVPVQLGNSLLLKSPWREWYKNYTYHVDSVEIYSGGSGYQYAPQVVFSPAPGDSGSGAAGEAYISQGKVTKVIITNPGSGYAATPIMTLLGGGPTTLTPARFGIRMSNGLVRSQTITLKFDRVSGYNEIDSAQAEDTFRANGYSDTYKLTWTPLPEKSLTNITVNGIKLLSDAYSFNIGTETFNGYTKSYGEIKLVNVPPYTATIVVNYVKDIGLYHAVDRIRDYYKPESGMPGNTATLLMAGLEYPGVTVDTLPLVSSTGYDSTPYGSSNWDDYENEIGLYQTVGSNSTTTFTLNYVPQIGNTLTVYVNNIRIYGTSTFSTSSQHLQLVNGLIQPDGYTNTVDIHQLTPGAISTTIATLVTGGVGPYPNTTGFVVRENADTLQVVPDWSCVVPGYAEPFIVTTASHNSLFNGRQFLLNGGVAFTLRFPITFYSPGNVNTVDFRLASSDGAIPIADPDIDTYISGGQGFTTIVTPGVADNPSPLLDDIIIDGDNLISRYNSYGPEENLPGRVSESLGISVYTQPSTGSALSVLRTYVATTGTRTYLLGTLPPNADSVEVLCNNNIITGYSINYVNQTITLTTGTTGLLSVRTLGIGGANTLDRQTLIATTATTVIDMAPRFVDVQDQYITINGIQLIKDTDFTLSAVNLRTRVTLTTPLKVKDVLQIWLFAAPIKAFSEVRSQTIIAQPGEISWALTYPPENIQPYHTQVIVEKDGRRLLPPATIYFTADGTTESYSLNTDYNWGQAVPSRKVIEVYVNGAPVTPSVGFNLIQNENRIQFLPNVLKQGDVVAICILLDYEFSISNNNLNITTNVTSTSTIIVHSFTNHDSSLIRTERYLGGHGNSFQLSRKVAGPEYLWVEYNGKPLMRYFDFTLINLDQIVLAPTFVPTPSDQISITSVSNIIDTDKTLGYRIFLDNLGRTTYKRISAFNSTKLATTLTSTATSIDLVDASVLTPPNFGKFIPGVIIINGERIQFYNITGNTISQLVRGSLGTGIRDSYPAGTTVLDQGAGQTLYVKDTQQEWMANVTNTGTFAYDISSLHISTTTPYTSIGWTTSTPYLNTWTSSTFVWNTSTPFVWNTSTTFVWNTSTPFIGLWTTSTPFIGLWTTSTPFIGWTTGTIAIWSTATPYISTSTPFIWDTTTTQSIGVFQSYENFAEGDREIYLSTTTGITVGSFINLSTSTQQYQITYVGVDEDGYYPVIMVSPDLTIEDQLYINSQKGNPLSITSTATTGHWSTATTGHWSTSAPYTITSSTTGYWSTTTTGYWSTTTTGYWNTSTPYIKGWTTSTPFLGYWQTITDVYDVYYQGRLLRKPSTVYTLTDTTIAYDSNETNAVGTQSNVTLHGEYTIRNGVLTLNTGTVLKVGSRIQVISRTGKSIYAQIHSTSTAVIHNIPVDPMHQNATAQVEFLSRSPAALPDKYYYGQQ
jgi:hypothetical protein